MYAIRVSVAPLVGAWIEIKSVHHYRYSDLQSLLSWERGLKYLYTVTKNLHFGRSSRGSVD